MKVRYKKLKIPVKKRGSLRTLEVTNFGHPREVNCIKYWLRLSAQIKNTDYIEEESQGEYDDDSSKDSGATATKKNPGRKSGHRKREETTDKEKELGLQTTLDNTFKKEAKGNRGPGVVQGFLQASVRRSKNSFWYELYISSA